MSTKCNLKRWVWWPLVALCALAGVLPSARAVNLVQEFYLPMPEAQIYQANNSIIAGTGSTIASTFSIVVTGNGTVIYYDQWEDGYETDLSNPTQPTTQIWGDGNDAHGIPPGFAHNPLGLPAGTVITLTNNVTLPRNPSTLLWDARDHVAANKALIISRAGWPIPTGPVFAGAVSVLSTMDYGTNYISPVGQNLTNNLFKYVGMFVMAAQNNTPVTIDPNGNGVGTINIVLNQGESYLVNGGILKGGRVTASKPIQADLIIGHVGASFASDWFTLYPVSAWSSAYYTPVGSATKVSQPAYVYLYNPGTSAITINYNTKVGSGSFSVPGTNGVFQFQMPVGSGASFVSAGGQNFYALCTVAANNTSDTAFNWGFTLVPKGALTTEATVGWGPGSADGTVNGSPVWVTPLANAKIYVDYKGDHAGPLTDPNGNQYDTNFTVTALQSQKIFDPSKNQTGMRVYTIDGTLITAAWGEDADSAQPGNPYIDAGTTVLPFPTPLVKKTAIILNDTNPPGLSVGDIVQYTVEVDNKGLLPLGNTVVIDAPSTNLTYIPNSTTLNSNSIPDSVSGTPFPLDAPGYTIPIILSQGTSTFQYLYQVNTSGLISNTVTIGGTKISSSTYLAPPPTTAATVSLNFSDTNGVPVNLYSVGANVFVTMTNAVGNTSSNSVQTISVTVVDTNSLDLETITLTETGNNTGIFRNIVGLPTSAISGLGQQDGILNVNPGDTLSVSYTDPVYSDSATATAAIQISTPNKQLYLSVNGSTNGTQALNRIDPVAYGHSPTHTSVDLGSVGGSGTTATIGVDGSASVAANTNRVAFSYTTGAGTNQLMLVSVAVDTTVAVNGVTNNGTALTLVGSTPSNGNKNKIYVYDLTNPQAGINNLVVALASSINVVVGVNTFSNVNQTTPLGTPVAATLNSVTVTTATNGLVFGAISSDGTITDSNGQTDLWNTNANAAVYSAGSRLAAGGAASVAMTWGGGAHSGSIGVPINPASTGGGGGGGGGTNVTSFVQTPSFYSAFTMPSGGTITITNFITVTNGVMPANPAITATLQFNGTNIITLSNPTYSSANSNLVWSGILASNVTVPAGQTISYVISNGQSGVVFHIDYDSTSKPSKITLPASTVIQVNTFGIYDAPYPGGNLVTTPIAGSTLYVRASISDPFGSYDITSVGLAVTGPSSGSSFTNTLTAANVVASDTLSKTYEYAWATGPETGGYNIAAGATEGTEGVTATAVASITTTFLDLGTPSTTIFTSGANGVATNSYTAGSPVCIQVTDLNRNTNAAAIDAVIVTVTSSSGDSEIVTLFETGTNTGIFVSCINTSTNIVGAPNDGTLFAPVGSILNASYTDPTDPTDNTGATATIQPAPGVPGVSMSKTIVSPSGGQVGVNQPVTYNLQVVNTGSTTLPSLSIKDTFPSIGLSYSSASLVPDTIVAGLLTWNNLGTFTPGQSTNITVTFTTLVAGTVTNSATASGVSATNTSSVTVLVNKAALNVTKILLSPTNTPVAVGSNVVFRITVKNVGNTTVNYLPLEDTFSGAYFQFVSATIPPDGSGAGSLLWTNLAYPVALATNDIITNDITMKVVGQGNPANNTATADFATDIFGNPVPTASSSIGVITASASINGHVYNDINQSGVFTNGDTGLSSVTLQLFTDPNGDGDPSDGTLVQITTTDANGYYELLNLNTGHYVVVETDLPGYASSAPVDNRLSLNVTNLTAFTNVNFFDYIPAPNLYSTISGTVWNDVNGNGTNDGGETGIANVSLDLVQDVNTNGLADSGEPVVASVTTDTGGNYSFAGVTPGNYVIREADSYGYYSTADAQAPNDNQISFASTNGIVSTNNNFFNRQSPVAVNDTNSTLYGTPVAIYPLTNDISPNGDVLTITNVTSLDGIAVINPGSTNITFTPTNIGVTTAIYIISDAHGGTSTAIITVGVSPAPLSVTANNASRTYEQTNPIFSGTLTGVVNGDNISATYATAAVTNSPAGTYPIVPGLVDPNGRLVNYTVSSTNGTLTVIKTTPAVSWPTPTNILYGTPLGTNQNSATSTVPGSFVYNPTNGTVLPAGTNTLTVVFTPGNTNYTTNASSVVLVVSAAPLSVTANNASRTYEQTNPIFSGTLTGVVNGDNISATYATAAVTNSPAGTYPIVPGLVDPNGRLVNYTVSSTNGTLTVIKTTPAVSWPTPTNILYGTPLGTNQNSATSTVPGSFVYNPTNGTVLPAGTNTLTVVFTPGNTNYTPVSLINVLLVSPAPLSVSANNASRAYGQTNPVFSGTLSGVVNGDNITATYASIAVTNSPAGTYPITPILADPNGRLVNYAVNSTNGTLTVSKTVPAVSWPTPTNIIYGTPLGTNQNNATATTPGSFSYNPANGVILPVGTNQLTVLFTPGNTNYTTNAASVVLVVTTAPLSVTANNASRTYGQTNPIFSGTLSGVVNGDNITATYASIAVTNSPAGTYPITPILADPNGRLVNYAVSSTNGTLTVTSNAAAASADLIVRLSGPTNVNVGDSFTYTVTLTNGGPSTASNVVAADSLPASLAFVSASGGGVFSNSFITWPTLASLANGATTNFTFTVSAPSPGLFTNTASATSTTSDPNPANNAGSSVVSQVQPVVAPAQFGILAGTNTFNPQTGLFEESVVVTNTGATTVAGVRLYVGGLRSGVTLYNATGTTNGTPYVEYDASLNPGNTVTFALEFYDVNRLPFTNTLTAVAILPSSLPSAGTNGVAVSTEFMDTRIAGDARFVIEFQTIPGKTYTILYSTNVNAAVWNIATPSITANANVTQWYDDGPPKTDSKPGSVSSRFYRVIQD